MLRSLKMVAATLPLLAMAAADLNAQIFTAPNAAEYVQGNVAVKQPEHTSCYSTFATASAFGAADLYLSAWDGPDAAYTGEFLWRLAPQGNPTGLFAQGSFLYTGVMGMEVTTAQNWVTNRLNIFVAYYKVGVGHFLDTYELNNAAVPNPVSLISSQQLSSATSYGRIRVDAFRTFYAVAVWHDPALGLRTMAYNGSGTWSGISTIAGSFNESGPDATIINGNGSLMVHFASYNSGANTITESAIDVNAILTSGGSISPLVEDVNHLGNPLQSDIVLDGPDLYDVENWAYTYTDRNEVFVHIMDHHTMSGPHTVSVNSGALGNHPTAGIQKAYSPALHFGNGATGGTTGQIMVGWYTTDGSSTNGYIALEIREDGSALLSNPDYMALPNGFTANTYPTYAGIAFSRNTLHAPGVLYATYYDFDASSGTPQLHHAFHSWGDVVFRGVNETGTGAVGAAITGTYPNPFNDVLHTSIVLQENASVQLELLDMTGRRVWQRETTMEKGAHQVEAEGLKKLSPGTYMLITSVNGNKLQAQKVVKQ